VIVDTLNNADTVLIINPDPFGSQVVCSRIASNYPEIVWMFRNEEGEYVLNFVAALESEHPTQTLIIDIDGHEFIWSPVENRELTKELTLGQNAIVRIVPQKNSPMGHTVHICLTIGAP
jgi:hypothetical protein